MIFSYVNIFSAFFIHIKEIEIFSVLSSFKRKLINSVFFKNTLINLL